MRGRPEKIGTHALQIKRIVLYAAYMPHH